MQITFRRDSTQGTPRTRSLLVLFFVSMVSFVLSAQSAPEISFDSNADFLKVPDGTFFGEVAGVATNSKGHVFVYTRTGAANATVGASRTFYKAGSRLCGCDAT